MPLDAVKAALKRYNDRVKQLDAIPKPGSGAKPLLPPPARGCHAELNKGNTHEPVERADTKLLACAGLSATDTTKIANINGNITNATKWWVEALKVPDCSTTPSAALPTETKQYKAIHEFVKNHLQLKLPFDRKEHGVNVFGAYIPFSTASKEKTNGNTAAQFVNPKDDARPFVCIPAEFKDVVRDYKDAVKLKSRSRSGLGSRSRSALGTAGTSKFLDSISYTTAVPLLGDVFLKALQVEREIVLPELTNILNIQQAELKKQNGTGTTTTAAVTTTAAAGTDFRQVLIKRNVCDVLGPLGAIVYFAVFGGSLTDLDDIKNVYDIPLLTLLQRVYLDNIALSTKKDLSSDDLLTDAFTEVVGGRRYLKGTVCSSTRKGSSSSFGGRRRSAYVDSDGDDDDDEDSA